MALKSCIPLGLSTMPSKQVRILHKACNEAQVGSVLAQESVIELVK